MRYYWTDATMQNHLSKYNITDFLRQVSLPIDGGKRLLWLNPKV